MNIILAIVPRVDPHLPSSIDLSVSNFDSIPGSRQYQSNNSIEARTRMFLTGSQMADRH